MLETIREYALRQLELRREEPAARRAHGRFFADWMASRYRNVRDQEPEAFERFAEEQPNLRATLEWALSVGEPALAARALYGGWFVWLATGAGHEARTWADRYLATDGRHLDEIADLGALIGVGEILRFTGDPARAAQVKERMVAIIRTHPKEELFGRPLSEELPPTLSDLGALKADENEFAAAEAYAREALALRRTLGHPLPRIAHALMVLGYVNYAQEDFAAASALWREAVDIDPQNQTGDFVARSLALAECALYAGELKEARRRLADAASVEEIPDQTVDVVFLRALALFAAERGDPYRVAALFGAADRLMEKQGLAVLGRHELRLQGRTLADARATLGDAFEEASCGLELETHAQVLALAREELAIAARAETPIA
jgi:tetratricopeptide (TPR) repeat protein